MSHAHLSSLRGDPEGSPWRLPGVVLVLAAIVTLVIVASFVIADLVAGRWY